MTRLAELCSSSSSSLGAGIRSSLIFGSGLTSMEYPFEGGLGNSPNLSVFWGGASSTGVGGRSRFDRGASGAGVGGRCRFDRASGAGVGGRCRFDRGASGAGVGGRCRFDCGASDARVGGRC